MTFDRDVSPTARLLRCWTPAARVVLIALAVPLAVRFVAVGAPAGHPSEAWPTLTVNINDAPLAVLEALPGLGPSLVGRIDAARRVQPIRSLDDLDRRVAGIGPAKASTLRPLLRFETP